MPAKVQMKRAAWLLLSVVILASLAAAQLPAEYLIYVGTYTEKTGSQGIYAYRFNRRTGEITPVGLAAKTEQPSFLAIPRNGKYLYAVNETNSGEVSAFRIEKDGMLTPLNRVPSGGAHPAHISVDTTGRNVLVANYTGGSVAAFRTQHDGTLTPAAAVVQHQGSSANPERQKGPHAHAIVYAPGEKLAVAVDLGTDELYVYNTAHGRLDRVGSAKVRSGAGPRSTR